MIFFSFTLLTLYLFFTLTVLNKIYKGSPVYLLLYIVCFLPFYTVFQLIIFKGFNSVILIDLIRFSKDFVLITSFIIYLVGKPELFLERKFKLSFLDKLIISFLFIVIIYVFLPLGESLIISKVIYAKNILLIGIVYFFGRNTNLNYENWNSVLKIIIGLIFLSFFISSFENICEI